MNNIVELRAVDKVYQNGPEKLQIFKDLNVSFPERKKIILSGESGSGKSTLLHLIAGLDMLTKGSIQSCGFDIHAMKERELIKYRAEHLGFIYQFHFLLSDLTALENIMLPGMIAKIPHNEIKDRAEYLLEKVGLQERSGHIPSKLSGGERQRIAVARALLTSPKLILADEPTGNLDEKNSRKVEELLFELIDEEESSLICVTHDSKLQDQGDITYVLQSGQVQSK
jgi:lipoprotein-releasing system ATP-binding protein